MLRQTTLDNAVTATGIGLHSGDEVRLVLRPAPAQTGIVFRRLDLAPVLEIPARAECVGDTVRATSLVLQGQRIATVEHLLAALYGLGIDNVYVDIDAAEVPIMDGSAAPFVHLLRSAGVARLDAPREFIRVTREVTVKDGDKFVSFLPYDGFKIAFTVDFQQPVFRQQPAHAELDLSRRSFAREIAAARTFGFLHELEGLRSRGLVQGGSLDNAVLLDDERILNEEGLRYPDELVKHKMLDALGDMCLLGYQLIGKYRAHKSGHTLNNTAVRALLAQVDAWERVTFDRADQAPVTRDYHAF